MDVGGACMLHTAKPIGDLGGAEVSCCAVLWKLVFHTITRPRTEVRRIAIFAARCYA